jgi:hypothetical protein
MISTVFFAGAGHAAPVVRDVPAAQGIVLSGGTIQLDFADPQFGFETANLDRLDEVVWSGGRGQLATTNFVVESGDSPGASDPQNFFGESLGVPTSQTDLPADPFVIYKGYASVASHQTATNLTTTTTGLDFRGNATNVPTASTSYTVYPADDPNQNEFRVSRTINFTSSTPLYASSGVRVYMPYVSNIFFIVIYPSTDGSIKQVETSKCIVCVIPDWNGQWFADDDDGDGGIMVIRDPSSTAPAQLVIDTEDETLNNLTSIALLQPTDGFKAPVTETEWVCFYDGSTWSYADQRAGNLPQGCSQKNQVIADTTPDAFAFTPVSGVTPNSMQTSNTVTITGINAAAPITVSGGTYSINGGTYTSAAGSINEGDTVVLQGIASTSYSTETSVTLTVGGVSGAFDVTTEPAPPPSVATVSGHVGGGGALGLGSLCALLLLVLAVRARSRHGVLAPGASAPGASARTAALLLGTCALSSLYASRASAEDPGNSAGPYVGIRAGISDYQFTPSDLQTRLGPAGSDLDSAAISKRQFGGMLYGGIPLYRNLMLELSYAQLGRFPLSTQTNSADADALAQRILGQLAPAGHGVTAGFAWPMQFGPVFGIEPRLSALYYQSKQVVSLATEVYRNDLRGVGLDAGLSTTWRVAAHWYAGVGLDCFHMTQACNVMTYTAQIELRFGPGVPMTW